MTWWEILLPSLAYGSGVLICARLLAGHLAYYFAESTYVARTYGEGFAQEPDGSQWFGAAMVGLALGLFWPLVWLERRLPWRRWAIGAEADAIRRQQAERIAELEREVGIR